MLIMIINNDYDDNDNVDNNYMKNILYDYFI